MMIGQNRNMNNTLWWSYHEGACFGCFHCFERLLTGIHDETSPNPLSKKHGIDNYQYFLALN
jgi:hypothetical protein